MQTWTDGHQNADLLRANSADFASFTERLLESKPNQDALLPDPAQTAAHAFFAPILASRFYRAITRPTPRRDARNFFQQCWWTPSHFRLHPVKAPGHPDVDKRFLKSQGSRLARPEGLEPPTF